MQNNPITVRIPGRRNERILVVNTHPQTEGIQKRTPEWMISFNDLSPMFLTKAMALKNSNGVSVVSTLIEGDVDTRSTVKGAEYFTELFGWNSESSRYVAGYVAGALFSSASIANSPLSVMLNAGALPATAEDALFKGKIFKAITIIRLGYIAEALTVMQTISFINSRMIRFQQQLDKLILHFAVLKKMTRVSVFTQKGMSAGVAVGIIDSVECKKDSFADELMSII